MLKKYFPLKLFYYFFMLALGFTFLAFASGCSGGGGSSSTSKPHADVVIPDNPTDVATSVSSTQATDIGDSTAFLYSGDKPIQSGVTADTIKKDEAAVVRGKVLDKEDNPLSGVQVSILNHPEYGYTYSRDDGMFDMAVNGGVTLTLNYLKDGYLKLQRSSEIPKQDFTLIDDVVMTALAQKVTTVDLQQQSKAFSTVQGAVTSDDRGIRHSTTLFPKNTSAQMVLPDGSTKSLSTMHVRSTEYTAGDNGPKAMPADLPDGVAYTYCVDMSVDEAEAAGATGVTFSTPVIHYVENFIGFPVGDIVPTYYYDKEQAKWIRTDDGKVIAIVSITNDLADIDIDGDGVADDVSSLGITEDERRNIATLYQAGTELWRTPVSHFSPIDHNWPEPPLPDDAPPPSLDDTNQDQDEENHCDESGSSIIEIQNQVLGESIPITGTPYELTYRSNRTSGSERHAVLNILLTLNDVKYIDKVTLDIYVAGRRFSKIVEDNIDTNTSYRFEWDGKDAYGRDVYGSQSVYLNLKYEYLVDVGSDQLRQTSRIIRKSVPVVVNPIEPLNIEGWSLNKQHIFDKTKIYLGNGEVQEAITAATPSGVITTIAGHGEFGYTGDNGPALDATFSNLEGISVASDGTIYIADTYNNVVRKITADEIITTVAGSGDKSWRYGVVNTNSATTASLNQTRGVSTTSNGSVLIINTVPSDGNGDGSVYYSTILKLDSNGSIRTVAGANVDYFYDGTNSCTDSPVEDNQKATARCIGKVGDVVATQDGSFYISVPSQRKIRKIDTDGIITTVAGTGEYGYSGDGGSATEALLGYPSKLALGEDGTLYFIDQQYIRKITQNGIISTIAGSGQYGSAGNGGDALLADLGDITGIGVDSHKNVFLLEYDSCSLRRVSPAGIIDKVIGTQECEYSGDGGYAAFASLNYSNTLAIDSNDNLYIFDGGRIRKVTKEEDNTTQDNYSIFSKDASQVYYFSAKQKHIKTTDALKNNVIDSFSYNINDALTQISDAYGNKTTIEYDENGIPTAIVAPYGQRTTLNVDTNHHLLAISNPANETWNFTYSDKGLMTSALTPNAHKSTYTYDAGLLVKAEDQAGGFKSLERTETSSLIHNILSQGYMIQKKTAMNYITNYAVQRESMYEKDTSQGDHSKLVFTNYISGLNTKTIMEVDEYGDKNITRADGTNIDIITAYNTHFNTRIPTNKQITLPSGLAYSMHQKKDVNLSNPQDPFSITDQTDTITVNGKDYTQRYDNTTKTTTFSSPEGRTLTKTFNNQGDVKKIVLGTMSAVDFNYNAKGKLTGVTQGERSINLDYNSAGYLSSITNPLSQTTTFTYDSAGRLTKQKFADDREISYTYDAKGNLLSLTPPQKPAHNFIYTLVEKMDSYTPPSVSGSGATHFSYNPDKQLTKITRPDGKTVDFGYDTAGRLSSVEDVTYAYNATTGNIKTVANGDAETLNFTFDGPLLTQTALSGAVAGSVAQSYNNDFKIIQRSVNGANPIDMSYDKDNLLTKVGDLNISRNAENGYISTTNLGAINDTRSIDTLAQLASYSANYNSTSIFHTEYTRDKLGRITQLDETVEGVVHTYVYTYDNAGRLSGVSKDGNSIGSYTYDTNGNRLTSDGVSATYDDQDRLLSFGSVSYSYTANGELLSRVDGGQTTSYTYDLLGNLKTVVLPDNTTIDYIVDGLNRRVGKKINDSLTQGFLYKDALNPIAELDGDNAIVSQFVYGTKSNVPAYMIKGGITYRIISDHLGSPRVVVNSTDGTIVQRMDYDAWGNVINDTNPGFQPFGFAGGIYDTQTKLTRFGVRDYDAHVGRWASKDPLLFGGRDSNLYGYVFNDPINNFDPSGKFGIIAGVAIAAAITAIVANADAISDFIDSLNNLGQSSDNAGNLINSEGEVTDAGLQAYDDWRNDTANAATCGGKVAATAPGTSASGDVPTSANDLISGDLLNRLLSMFD